MLDSVLYARDRYLTTNGCLLPDHGCLKLLGLEDHEAVQQNLECWKDMYGFKMSCMRAAVLREAAVKVVDSEKICTNSCDIKVGTQQK